VFAGHGITPPKPTPNPSQEGNRRQRAKGSNRRKKVAREEGIITVYSRYKFRS